MKAWRIWSRIVSILKHVKEDAFFLYSWWRYILSLLFSDMPIVSDSFNLEPYTVSYSCFFLFYLLNAWNTLALDVPFNSKLHQTLITFWIFKLFLHIRANVKQEGQRQTTNIIKMTVWPESQEFKRIDYGFKLKCTNESSSRISYREALRICRILSSQYELGRFTHLCSSEYNPWSTALFL